MDVIVIGLVMASMLGMGTTFVVVALRDTAASQPTDDSDFPPLDYRRYRGEL